MAAIHYSARPRTRALLPTLNGVWASLKHTNLQVFSFLNYMGLSTR